MSDDQRKPVDEEDAEVQRMIGDMHGLPLDYMSGGESIAQHSLIAAPDARQLRVFQNARVRTCSSCKHFDNANFVKVAGAFMKKLVHEYEWNPKYIGDHPSKMGRCGQDEQLVVGPNSLGCDAYRAK